MMELAYQKLDLYVTNLNAYQPIIELSKEVYTNLGGGNFDEKDYQKALGFELSDNNISYLREFHLEIFYKDKPIKLGAPDFFK